MAAARIDHVVRAVDDLDEAAVALREEFGLDSVAGGRHTGWGTGNRIVPLGPDYIELIAVLDREEAALSFLGSHVLEQLEGGDRFIGWCVAVDDVEPHAARLGLEVTTGSRTRPDETVLRWRSAGLQEAMEDPSVPFFVAWDVPPELHPGRAAADHSVRPEGISWIEVGTDALRLKDWLDGEELPVRVVGGPPGVLGVGIATGSGEIVLR
jgi:hypothetical protein